LITSSTASGPTGLLDADDVLAVDHYGGHEAQLETARPHVRGAQLRVHAEAGQRIARIGLGDAEVAEELHHLVQRVERVAVDMHLAKDRAVVWSTRPRALVAKNSRACGCQPGFSVAGRWTYSAASGFDAFQVCRYGYMTKQPPQPYQNTSVTSTLPGGTLVGWAGIQHAVVLARDEARVRGGALRRLRLGHPGLAGGRCGTRGCAAAGAWDVRGRRRAGRPGAGRRLGAAGGSHEHGDQGEGKTSHGQVPREC
jgi:hypothetical protein